MINLSSIVGFPIPASLLEEKLEKILIELKPEDRMVVALHYYKRIPLPEIAERMDWSLSKTKVRSYRAWKRLETVLKRHGIESV